MTVPEHSTESRLQWNIPPEKLIELHKSVVRLRHTEETLAARYSEREMRTPTHFGIGQEAVAAGVAGALQKGDVVYSHHRCHNHYLACGGSVYGLAAELYGRSTGCSGGRGGSVHLTDLAKGVVATSAILGQTIAVATGSALAFKMDGSRRVAVTFFGEAACEEGVFYEALNYASVHKLPVLFACENNLYSTESPLSVRQPSGTSLCERTRAFKVTSESVDGNDVAAVYSMARWALERCRAGEGPVFIESMTYRWREHVGPLFDHEVGRTYRSKAELETWMQRCPVQRSGEMLVHLGIASEGEVADWSAGLRDEIVKEVEAARSAPWPEDRDLFANV